MDGGTAEKTRSFPWKTPSVRWGEPGQTEEGMEGRGPRHRAGTAEPERRGRVAEMLRSATPRCACWRSLPPGPSISTDQLVLPTSLPLDLEQVLKRTSHPLAHSACLVHLSPGVPTRLLGWLQGLPREVLPAHLSPLSSLGLAEPSNPQTGHGALGFHPGQLFQQVQHRSPQVCEEGACSSCPALLPPPAQVELGPLHLSLSVPHPRVVNAK